MRFGEKTPKNPKGPNLEKIQGLAMLAAPASLKGLQSKGHNQKGTIRRSVTVSKGCHLDPHLGPTLGPSRCPIPECEGVPSRFAMCTCFVLQRFGPKTLRAQILKKIKILKFSSELEIFKRATHQTPYFLWGILEVRIENFKRS